MNTQKWIECGVIALCLSVAARAGSFSAYAQAYPLPNYYAGQVTVPSTGSVTQDAAAFYMHAGSESIDSQVINEGPLGTWVLTASPSNNPSISESGSCSAGTYNYEVEVIPENLYSPPLSSSGYSVVTISW